MLAVREIAIALTAVVVFREIIVMVYYWCAKLQVSYDSEILNLIVSLAIFALFIVIGHFLKRRLESFARRFVDSVYRSFLTYCLTEQVE
jgi:Kef-type K+ transport system membrane component KefB